MTTVFPPAGDDGVAAPGAIDESALAQVLDEFAATVIGDFRAEDVLRQLALAAMRVLSVDGAGVMIPEGGELLRFVFATGPDDGSIHRLELLQEQLQDGPCRTCHETGRLITVADLGSQDAWPEYARTAVRHGLRAVTALPLYARGRIWGVLDLYRSRPHRFQARELAVAQTLANLATSYLVVSADRDAARQAQRQLAHRAMHDPLTGLPVRWVFLEQAGHALARLGRHPGTVGVLFVDVDGLKYVNDTYGHPAGDRFLTTCVQRIQAALRPSDVLARLGGDEFVVLLEDLADSEAGTAIGSRILRELAAPYHPEGQLLQPSASLGLALSSDPEQTPDALIAQADQAMYRAKHAGPGRFELFDPTLHAADRAEINARGRRAAELRHALAEQRFELHYQVVVELAGRAEGGPVQDQGRRGVYAVEALVRWRHPERGLLAADDFIADVARAGLMGELGRWVLRTACHQLATWDVELPGRTPHRMFVNMSVEELARPAVIADVAAILEETGIAPDRLTMEVTENGLFVDPPVGTAALNGLQELGCQLAIDDFGTGYASLSRLVEVPAATLKVDRSLTRDLSSSATAVALVSAVLLLGRTLGRTVVVEGVEDDVTLSLLQDLGCTHAQGYRFAEPRPATTLTALLQTAPGDAEAQTA